MITFKRRLRQCGNCFIKVLRAVALPMAALIMTYIVIAFSLTLYLVMNEAWGPEEYNARIEEQIRLDRQEHLATNPDDAFAAVVISVRSIDAENYAANVVVAIRLTGSHLIDSAGRSVMSPNIGPVGISAAAAGDAGRDGDVSATITTTQGAVSVPIPARDFDPRSGTASATVTMPITGFPQKFPEDSYNLWAISWVDLPEGINVRRSGSRDPATSIRTHTYFEIGSGLTYRRARPGKIASVTTDPRLKSMASVELHRPARYYRYIWAVCTVPPAFLALYFFLSVAGRVSGTSHFELGVATLALIAMRQFFVPEGAVGITTLDHWLAESLVACVLLAAMIALIQKDPVQAPEAGRPEDPPSPQRTPTPLKVGVRWKQALERERGTV